MLQVRSASGYDATCVFEFVEEPFDAIAQRIEQRIDWALNVAIALGRDDRIGAVEPGILTDGVAIVAVVGEGEPAR